ACMLMVPGPTGHEGSFRYMISDCFDRLFVGRRAFAVTTVVNIPDEQARVDDEAVPILDVAGEAKAPLLSDWPMFGGTLHRNMANPAARNVPTDWSAEEGKLRNIKWIASLGSKSYGGPIVADGKVFFGTNNGNPRDPAVKGTTKGVMMCF